VPLLSGVISKVLTARVRHLLNYALLARVPVIRRRTLIRPGGSTRALSCLIASPDNPISERMSPRPLPRNGRRKPHRPESRSGIALVERPIMIRRVTGYVFVYLSTVISRLNARLPSIKYGVAQSAAPPYIMPRGASAAYNYAQ